MIRILNRICVFSVAVLVTATAFGQSVTYDPATGVMGLDSDSSDVVAVFITGPDVSTFDLGCTLCDGSDPNLPGDGTLAGSQLPGGSATDVSSWTVGYSAGSTQWIRTNPLAGNGFRGNLGDFFIDANDAQQPWPEDLVIGGNAIFNFPEADQGLAVYATGLREADFGEVTWAMDNGGVLMGEVTFLPEPSAFSLLGLASLALIALRRR